MPLITQAATFAGTGATSLTGALYFQARRGRWRQIGRLYTRLEWQTALRSPGVQRSAIIIRRFLAGFPRS